MTFHGVGMDFSGTRQCPQGFLEFVHLCQFNCLQNFCEYLYNLLQIQYIMFID